MQNSQPVTDFALIELSAELGDTTTILACLPCMGTLQSTEACYSYANCLETEECYESVVVSSKNVGQTRLLSALHHKVIFPYECLLHL